MTAVAVGLLSAAILAYEVLLTRLFAIVQWHSFAFMIISLALLGFGAGGTFVTLAGAWLRRRFAPAFAGGALLFAGSAPAAFAAAQSLPFNALELIWDPRQVPYLVAVYALLAVPFFFGASCIALALSRPGAPIARLYAFDLLGAGCGAFGIVLALFARDPLDCLMLVAALGLLAAACAALAGAGPLAWAAAAALGLAALALPWTGPWMSLRISPYKGLSMALRLPEARVLAEASGPLGLVTVVESPRIPFRQAPGLSLAATAEPPPQLGLFTDAEAMSPIATFDGDPAPLAFLDFTTAALPYHLLRRPETLILGAGGGAPILLALYHEAARIDAVELNPDVVRLADRRFGAFSGHVYSRAPVRPHVAEARAFVAGDARRYDLIELPPQGSFAAAAAGAFGLGESYTDTVEAFLACLERLKPGGLLAATRWVDLPPRAALRLFATAAAALERQGVARPGDRLAMIRGWQTATLIAKNGDLAPEDIAAIRGFAEARAFDLVHLPGMTAAEANRFNRLEDPWFFAGAQALLGPEREDFLARYKFDIRPATDDRPYAGDFFRWRALPEILALRAQGGAALLEWGYLVLIATLLQAALLGAALILLPLAAAGMGAGTRLPRPGRGRIAAYFLAVGLAFLLLEIAFIQRFTLFLGSPLYAVAVVLAGFLLFAGIGSAAAPRLARGVRRPIAAAAAAIATVAILWLLLLPPLLARLIALPDAAKIALALLLIAPLAVPMGMPFPLALARLDPAAVPWAWAINGCASVAGAVLASLLAREAGFTAVVLLAAALYLGAAAAAPGASDRSADLQVRPLSRHRKGRV